MNETKKGVLFALLAPTFWGMMTLPIRTLGEYGIEGQDLSFFRCLIAGAGLFLCHLFVDRDALKVDARGLLISVLYGCASYGVCFVSYAIAVERIPVAVAMVLMFLGPIWVSLMNRIVFHEKLKRNNAVSIVICLIGAVLVSQIINVRGSGGLDPIGILCAVLNGFGASLQLIVPRYFEKRYQKDTLLIYGFLGVAAVMAFFCKFDVVAAAVAAAPGKVLGNLFFLAVICTLLANLLYVQAGSYVDSTLVSILAALEVVVGALVGYLVYCEELTVLQSIGAVVIVVGVLLPNLSTLLCGRRAS